jgi:hypothetical protein
MDLDIHFVIRENKKLTEVNDLHKMGAFSFQELGVVKK